MEIYLFKLMQKTETREILLIHWFLFSYYDNFSNFINFVFRNFLFFCRLRTFLFLYSGMRKSVVKID